MGNMIMYNTIYQNVLVYERKSYQKELY